MKAPSDGIRILPGATALLVVAPHGPFIDGRFENDVRTGIIAEQIHRRLGCTAIINTRYFKPKGYIKKDARAYLLDLYRVDHARKVGRYIQPLVHGWRKAIYACSSNTNTPQPPSPSMPPAMRSSLPGVTILAVARK